MTFEQMLTEAQPRLYAYLLKRIRKPDVVKDVLQEVNIVIWIKKTISLPGAISIRGLIQSLTINSSSIFRKIKNHL